jgi:glutamyl-tRNA reductase
LVVGAGGTARAAIYALKSLGVGTVYVYNRTKRKAEELVEQAFGGDKTLKVVDDLEGLARETEGTQNSRKRLKPSERQIGSEYNRPSHCFQTDRRHLPLGSP